MGNFSRENPCMGDDFCIYFERLINGVLVCEEGFSFLANHAILVIINKFRPRRESCVEKVYSELYSWVKSILIAIIIVFICRHFLFSPSIVYGESMEPTFANNDRIIVSKISEIERFDIIVFDAPDGEDYYIKRVIGIPGDSIVMKDDVLYINGIAYDEPYLQHQKDEMFSGRFTGDFTLEQLTGERTVPEDSYFVLGDNRMHSKDSRVFGFISKDAVIGEVKFRFYPFSGFGFIK